METAGFYTSAVARRYLTLADYFTQTGESKAALARTLGVTRVYVSQLAAGKRQPALDMALRIHRETGVPLESLVTQEERAS